jgi:hypothetical protein
MTRQHLFPLLGVAVAVGCRSPNPERWEPSTGDDGVGSSGGDDSGGDPSTTTSASTTSSDPTGADEESTGGSTTTSDGASDSSESGSSDGAPMACTGACVSPPEGWNGPVTLGGECADDVYAHLEVSGYGDVAAPDAQCDCECGVGADVDCAATLLRYGAAACFAIDSSYDLVPGCNVGVGAEAGYFATSYAASGGSCDATPSVMLPPFELEHERAACGTMELADGVCDGDQACVPAPSDAAPLCWWMEGDVACPDTLDGTREVIYTGEPIDGRGCEECSCNEPSGSCEQSIAYLVGNNNACQLNGPGFLPVAQDDCTQFGEVLSVLLGEPTPTTTCVPTGVPAPTGSVDAQGPVTVCCEGGESP